MGWTKGEVPASRRLKAVALHNYQERFYLAPCKSSGKKGQLKSTVYNAMGCLRKCSNFAGLVGKGLNTELGKITAPLLRGV